MNKERTTDPVPKGQLTAYERWELPLVGKAPARDGSALAIDRNVRPAPESDPSGHRPALDQSSPGEPLPTAGELEDIRAAARQEGLDEGREEGLRSGREEGFAQGLEEGRQQGMEAGRKQGYEDGQLEAAEARAAAVARLESIASQLLTPIENQRDKVEKALLQLVCHLAEAVLQHELQGSSTAIRFALKQALDALPDAEDLVRIHLNPQDVEMVESMRQESEGSWKLHADSAVQRGGCRIETRESLIDHTSSARFARLCASLFSRAVDAERQAAIDEREATELQEESDRAQEQMAVAAQQEANRTAREESARATQEQMDGTAQDEDSLEENVGPESAAEHPRNVARSEPDGSSRNRPEGPSTVDDGSDSADG